MAEENQVIMNIEETMRGPKKETMRELKEVTTKDPKKIEVGRRLAEYNHRKSKQVEPMLDLSTCHCIGAVLAVGVIGSLGYYIYHSKVNNNVPPQQPSHPHPQTSNFEME